MPKSSHSIPSAPRHENQQRAADRSLRSRALEPRSLLHSAPHRHSRMLNPPQDGIGRSTAREACVAAHHVVPRLKEGADVQIRADELECIHASTYPARQLPRLLRAGGRTEQGKCAACYVSRRRQADGMHIASTHRIKRHNHPQYLQEQMHTRCRHTDLHDTPAPYPTPHKPLPHLSIDLLAHCLRKDVLCPHPSPSFPVSLHS
jgi:hypothetical protein